MTEPTHIPPAGTNWRVVAGFVDPDLPNWRRVRGAQYCDLLDMFPLTCMALAAGAILIGVLFARDVPAWQLGIWTVLVFGVLGFSFLHDARVRPALAQGPRPGVLRSALTRAGTLGLLATVPPALFAVDGTLEQQLATCIVCCALMALATVTASPVPGVLMAYLLPASLGLSVMLARTHSPMLALVPPVYAGLLAIGGIGLGRALIVRLWADQALEEKRAVVSLLLREFEESAADWLWETDTAKQLVSVSQRFARAAARPRADMDGMPIVRLLAGPASETAPDAASDGLRLLVDRMNARERVSDMEFEVVVDGDTRWWSLSATPRYDAGGGFEGYRGVGSDITEQRRSAERIDRLARFDALTGLPNRREFMDKLRQGVGGALGDRAPCALLLVDLDKFKPVNDTLGHPIGDRLLKLVAERLRGLLGPGDLCGRLGGDEFAIILARVDPGAIERLGGGIIAALGTPFEIDGNVIRIGASVGSALAPRDGRSVETLMRNADLALYRAKDDGRGTLRRYDPSLLVQAERRRSMETALREAIDGGDQFRLLYQPVVGVDGGRIQSFEALIRWTHPTLGDVPPADFLPIAEEARLAGRIGDWVLRTACQEASGWPDDVRLSVNLARAQLHDRQFASTVLSALSHAGLEPHRLELEVSETFFLKEDATMVAVLDAVQALGVRIALDDFGAGYASLGHIRFGRFSALKVDTSFVRGAADGSRESLAVVRAGVAMAGALGIATVAEGAESGADLISMRGLGLDRIQGHFAGSPMTAAAARTLLANRGHAPRKGAGPAERRSVA